MINNILLKNFKCFENLKISPGLLNIFSGLNGMGKSTIIQSLLLLRQSYERGFLPQKVLLNGEYVSLGTGRDLLFENANEEIIRTAISSANETLNFEIKYEANSDLLNISNPLDKWEENIPSFFCNSFEYLSAERLSPQTVYEKSSLNIDIKSQLGVYGQYTAHYLAKYQDEIMPWDFVNNTYREGVQYWLNEISPNVKININEIQNADLAQISYYYSESIDSLKSNRFRPTNVGFGISYCLPVITALLKAVRGSVLIIENPEAHLHPQGQRKMGELIAKCANSGVQVFVETHSDHVMNGIRIAVKDKIIDANNVSMMYFSKKRINGIVKHVVENPKILENGKLDFWPEGFFDEWEKALDELI